MFSYPLSLSLSLTQSSSCFSQRYCYLFELISYYSVSDFTLLWFLLQQCAAGWCKSMFQSFSFNLHNVWICRNCASRLISFPSLDIDHLEKLFTKLILLKLFVLIPVLVLCDQNYDNKLIILSYTHMNVECYLVKYSKQHSIKVVEE